jgi:uncharacterized protein (DUF2164 family)
MHKMPTNSEFLPNGIHVHKLNVDEAEPWIASIRIGPWYYCQGGEDRNSAIEALFKYMNTIKEDFETYLKRDQKRLATLLAFLNSIQHQSGFTLP